MTEKQVYIREVKELCEGLRKIRGVENIILTTRDGYPISICGLWTSKRDVFDMCSITAALNTAISHSHRQGSPLIYQGEELAEDTYIFNYYFNTGAESGYEANVDRTASLNIATLALERGLVSFSLLRPLSAPNPRFPELGAMSAVPSGSVRGLDGIAIPLRASSRL
ncbi:MAG: hypothetical protein J7L50_01165 [Candidatus Odinarchaeota archaeon]|nr:hypothetical protein [Candidatus Odinarchaeota archaeon]